MMEGWWIWEGPAISDRHFRFSDTRFSDTRFARLGPLPPNRNRGVRRVDGRRVIPGIIRVPRNGPGGGAAHRPGTAAQNAPQPLCARGRAGVFNRIFRGFGCDGRATDTVMIYATHLKASALRPFHPARKEVRSRRIGRIRGGPDPKPRAIRDGRGGPVTMLSIKGQADDLVGPLSKPAPRPPRRPS